MKKLSPSLLSADFFALQEQIPKLARAGVQYLHLDVMDGHFVPNISFGAPVIKPLRAHTDMVFDVHLMIEHPEKYLKSFADAGADIINVHQEAVEHLPDVLGQIKQLGKKAAVTIKPKTPVEAILDVLPLVDMALVMTVEPGFGGQKMLPEALLKIPELCRIREEKGLAFEIEVDGGITLENIREALAAGADVIVSGSAIFQADDIEEASRKMLAVCKEFS